MQIQTKTKNNEKDEAMKRILAAMVIGLFLCNGAASRGKPEENTQ